MEYYFNWISGTASHNMINVFKENNIPWFLDNMKIKVIIQDRVVVPDYKHIRGNTFQIYFTEEKNYESY